jgi:cytidine deaminase
MNVINWDALDDAARDIMQRAYAPYSKFKVGVAALVDDGRIVRGCNVENAAYGVGLCAECGLVSDLHATGGGVLVAVSCVDQHGNALMPCGRCRQLLWEHGSPETLLKTPEGIWTLRDVLPQAFGPQDLIDRAEDRHG